MDQSYSQFAMTFATSLRLTQPPMAVSLIP